MKSQDKNTGYFLEIELRSKEVINLETPFHSIFITEGPYNKLLEKWDSQ